MTTYRQKVVLALNPMGRALSMVRLQTQLHSCVLVHVAKVMFLVGKREVILLNSTPANWLVKMRLTPSLKIAPLMQLFDVTTVTS